MPDPVNPCADLLADDARLSRLAMELARDIYPAKQIFALFKITEADFAEHISCSPVFMTYYAEAREVWNSSTNAAQRVALKSGILFEQWLETANTMLHDARAPAADRIKLATYLSRLAGFENVHNNPALLEREGGSGKSTVIINLGHGRPQMKIEKVLGDDAVDVPAEVTTIDDHGRYVHLQALRGAATVHAAGDPLPPIPPEPTPPELLPSAPSFIPPKRAPLAEMRFGAGRTQVVTDVTPASKEPPRL